MKGHLLDVERDLLDTHFSLLIRLFRVCCGIWGTLLVVLSAPFSSHHNLVPRAFPVVLITAPSFVVNLVNQILSFFTIFLCEFTVLAAVILFYQCVLQTSFNYDLSDL